MHGMAAYGSGGHLRETELRAWIPLGRCCKETRENPSSHNDRPKGRTLSD
jgi:hypothetical protein